MLFDHNEVRLHKFAEKKKKTIFLYLVKELLIVCLTS